MAGMLGHCTARDCSGGSPAVAATKSPPQGPALTAPPCHPPTKNKPAPPARSDTLKGGALVAPNTGSMWRRGKPAGRPRQGVAWRWGQRTASAGVSTHCIPRDYHLLSIVAGGSPPLCHSVLVPPCAAVSVLCRQHVVASVLVSKSPARSVLPPVAPVAPPVFAAFVSFTRTC